MTDEEFCAAHNVDPHTPTAALLIAWYAEQEEDRE